MHRSPAYLWREGIKGEGVLEVLLLCRSLTEPQGANCVPQSPTVLSEGNTEIPGVITLYNQVSTKVIL